MFTRIEKKLKLSKETSTVSKETLAKSDINRLSQQDHRTDSTVNSRAHELPKLNDRTLSKRENFFPKISDRLLGTSDHQRETRKLIPVGLYRQLIQDMGKEARSTQDKDLSWKKLNGWQETLSKVEEKIKEHRLFREGHREGLTKITETIESRRLEYSRKQYDKRYADEVHPVNDVDPAIDKFLKKDGINKEDAYFIRTEVKDIRPEYYDEKNAYWEKDKENADTEYPNKDSKINFEQACYRNYIALRNIGGKTIVDVFVTEVWRDRDKAKNIKSEAFNNSEMLVNQVFSAIHEAESQGKTINRAQLKLRSMTSCIVSNPKSTEVARKWVPEGEERTFEPGSEARKEILETPNCRSFEYMPKQYRHLFGNVESGSMHVVRYEDTDYGYGQVDDRQIMFREG